MLDKIGFEIPTHLEDAWTEADKIGRELSNEIQRIYLQIEKARAVDDLIFREVGQSCVEDLKNAWRALQGVIPYAVCPYDKGDPVARLNCPACHERGYLSKFRWKSLLRERRYGGAHSGNRNGQRSANQHTG
jgi:hypothetical protein